MFINRKMRSVLKEPNKNFTPEKYKIWNLKFSILNRREITRKESINWKYSLIISLPQLIFLKYLVISKWGFSSFYRCPLSISRRASLVIMNSFNYYLKSSLFFLQIQVITRLGRIFSMMIFFFFITLYKSWHSYLGYRDSIEKY